MYYIENKTLPLPSVNAHIFPWQRQTNHEGQHFCTEATLTLIKPNMKTVRLTLRFLQHGNSEQSSIQISVTRFISGYTPPQLFSNIYLDSVLIWWKLIGNSYLLTTNTNDEFFTHRHESGLCARSTCTQVYAGANGFNDLILFISSTQDFTFISCAHLRVQRHLYL